MEESWITLDEFPDYAINKHGHVKNLARRRPVATSVTRDGTVKVALMDYEGVRRTRSVSLLVANIFVEGQTELFNVPMHKDNNPENVCSDNLVWRPKGFVHRYRYQFREIDFDVEDYYVLRPVIDVMDKQLYENIFTAATTLGVLMRDVFYSAYNGTPVFPDWRTFEFAK